MRPLFSRGSSTRSVRSAEKKDDRVRDVNVSQQPRNHRVQFTDDNVQEKPSEGPLTDEEQKLYYYDVSTYRSIIRCRVVEPFIRRDDSSIHIFFWLLTFAPTRLNIQEDDFYKFDRDRALTALIYRSSRRNGMSWDDDKESVRGLEEIWLKEKKQDIRRRHAMTVLTAQKQEILAGRRPDPEILGEVSAKASKEYRQRAVALGKEDSVAAGTRHRSFRGNRKSPNTSPILNAANKLKKKLAKWSHQDKEQLRWSH